MSAFTVTAPSLVSGSFYNMKVTKSFKGGGNQGIAEKSFEQKVWFIGFGTSLYNLEYDLPGSIKRPSLKSVTKQINDGGQQKYYFVQIPGDNTILELPVQFGIVTLQQADESRMVRRVTFSEVTSN